MAVYAIGDVQGCYSALIKLLQKINFNSAADKLWFTGDIVNRGSQSLETLRFIKSLGEQHCTVLGNHDLHLLAVAHGAHAGFPGDTLQPILAAKDRDELIDWLCRRPLLHHEDNFLMLHAGLAPNWTLLDAKKYAREVEMVLQNNNQRMDFFRNMYGNFPDQWSEDLTGVDRLRCITNYLTRARFCYPDGRLALKLSENVSANTAEFYPWYKLPNRKIVEQNIIFGHWAALGGVTNTEKIFALDTGCVWGFSLTAMRLDDGQRFSVGCG